MAAALTPPIGMNVFVISAMSKDVSIRSSSSRLEWVSLHGSGGTGEELMIPPYVLIIGHIAGRGVL